LRFPILPFLLAFTALAAAQLPDRPIQRPKITGISHIALYASDPAATDHYYREIIGAEKQTDPEDPRGVRYALSATQFIEVLPLPEGAGINRLDHTAWNTTDAEGLRKYLAAKSYKVPGAVQKGADGSRWFAVKDPEGNKVEFVEPPAQLKRPNNPAVIGRRIIHMGYLVHSRAVEDAFYRDLLAFKPYWFGGGVDGRVDYICQQSPESHDWLEYMMTDPTGSGIPAAMSRRGLGARDHFSIGVASVDEAFAELEAGNRLTGVHDAHTLIGRDGKGELNLYDPDFTRIELMNFHATEKPCCSPFTAEDPEE
jgi:catechol 2,3-dioxygenase-like lactoylglutathione lyase family enzyme